MFLSCITNIGDSKYFTMVWCTETKNGIEQTLTNAPTSPPPLLGLIVGLVQSLEGLVRLLFRSIFGRFEYDVLMGGCLDLRSLRSLTAKHTISDQRASLKSETIELLECLKSWFRLGIFTEKDLHAIVEIMTSPELDGLV